MCGVFGSFNKVLNNDEIFAVKQKLGHRGPDFMDHLSFDEKVKCTLVHTRLSILDLTNAGNQPMVSADKRYVISYNGEIYNFKYLKNYLELQYSGIVWSSNSDTEVILTGWQLEGEKFLRKLNGMFAFLLLDLKKNQLFAIRDPFGIKPLFFAEQNQGYYFSSELKGFDGLRHFNKSVDVQSLKSQLTFMYIPEPRTLYNEIQKLEPGVLYRLNQDGISTKKLFNDLLSRDNSLINCSEKELIDLFRENFFNSVSNQMIADVPVGIMLSGGLDSSAVVEGAYQTGHKISAAFTLVTDFENAKADRQTDDHKYAKSIADKYDIPLHTMRASPDYFQDYNTLSDFFEDGFSDPAALATYYLSKLASDNGIKVLLTGQGADELLYGYRRYTAMKWLQVMPNMSWMQDLMNSLPNDLTGKYNAHYRRFRKLLNVMLSPKSERYAELFSWCDQKFLQEVFIDGRATNSFNLLSAKLNDKNDNSLLQNTSYADIQYDLTSLNLTYCDRMTMAAGVEARVPFLDFDLAKICINLPDKFKLRKSTNKYILKKSMEGYLPNEIIHRDKAGFALPIRSWIKNLLPSMVEFFDPNFLKKQGIFNPDVLSAELHKFKGGSDANCYFFSLTSSCKCK